MINPPRQRFDGSDPTQLFDLFQLFQRFLQKVAKAEIVGATSREHGPVEPRLPLPLSMVVSADEDEDVLFQDVLPSPIGRARPEAYVTSPAALTPRSFLFNTGCDSTASSSDRNNRPSTRAIHPEYFLLPVGNSSSSTLSTSSTSSTVHSTCNGELAVPRTTALPFPAHSLYPPFTSPAPQHTPQ